MTNDQKKTIEELRSQFNNNCKLYVEYGSNRICNFQILFNEENPEDKNITVVVTAIDGVSDNFQPYIKTSNIMVEPDGITFNMSDVFPESKVVEYVQKLKKIS
jgi:hypothetical protein